MYPSDIPSAHPSASPSERPSERPSTYPSIEPSIKPTSLPSEHPSSAPTLTCKNVIFTTGTDSLAGSRGPIEITGYGDLPTSCHDSIGATCAIELCNMETLEIISKTWDGWYFSISGDVGILLEHNTVTGGTHVPPFPTWMDTDQFDYRQKYKLKCQTITFTTGQKSYSESPGPFEITGYGHLPTSCHSSKGATCTIELCNRDTFEVKSLTGNGWYFWISGNVGELLSHTTVDGGTHVHPFPTWMDTDEYDSMQTYSLAPERDMTSIPDASLSEWSSDKSDGQYHKILESDSIDILQLDSKNPILNLSFEWKDQGAVYQKGRYKIELLSSTDEVLTYFDTGLAPHDWTALTKSFNYSDDIILKFEPGCKYALFGYVGTGRGHELHLRNIQMTFPADGFMKYL